MIHTLFNNPHLLSGKHLCIQICLAITHPRDYFDATLIKSIQLQLARDHMAVFLKIASYSFGHLVTCIQLGNFLDLFWD